MLGVGVYPYAAADTDYCDKEKKDFHARPNETVGKLNGKFAPGVLADF